MTYREELARKLIDAKDPLVYNVAANHGQVVANVAHMQWFVQAVAEEIDPDL